MAGLVKGMDDMKVGFIVLHFIGTRIKNAMTQPRTRVPRSPPPACSRATLSQLLAWR